VRWNARRFIRPNDPYERDSDFAGWKRGEGDGLEWWIRPATWRGIFTEHNLDPVEAARRLRDLEMLRVQDSENLQRVCMVAGKRSVRAYVIDGAALAEFRVVTGKNYGTYERPGVLLSPEIDARLISPTNSIDPPNLAAKLETAASQALDEALSILQLQPHRDDRVYSAVLRAKTAVINSVLSTQVRADEAMLRAKREDVLAEHLATAHACALATLGREREMTAEDIKRVLDNGYLKLDKPAPPGVIERLERLQAGEKPPKARRDDAPTFDGDGPFDA
jgi:hypothetical protein